MLGCISSEQQHASVEALHQSVMSQVSLALDDASALTTLIESKDGRKYSYDAIKNSYIAACNGNADSNLTSEEASALFELEMS